MFQRAVAILILLTTCLGLAGAEPPGPDAIDEALASAGLTRADLGWQPRGWWSNYPGDIPFKLRSFDDLMAEPLATVPYVRSMGASMLQYLTPEDGQEAQGVRGARPLHRAVHALGINRKYGGFRSYSANLIAEPGDLATAILACWTYAGRPTRFVTFGDESPYPQLEKDVKTQCAAVPEKVNHVLGQLVLNLLDAQRWADRAFRNVPLELRVQVVRRLDTGREEVDALDYQPAFDDVARLWDEASLWYAAMKTVDALDIARRGLVGLDVSKLTGSLVDIETPLGRIAVHGSDSSTRTFAQDKVLLCVDLGGKDVWRGHPASAGPTQPISVMLEMGGDDSYLPSPDGRDRAQGVGVTGVGVLLDVDGADSYAAVGSMAQGAGQFGFGALIDLAGNDQYRAEHSAQGCGYFGVGCLFDLGGRDAYSLHSEGQGFGGVAGVGVLADRSGNDTYTADPDPKITGRPSYHTDKAVSVSNAQGCAMGRRGDGADGHSWAGGLGCLLDGAGDDTYTAGNWAQGTGYWFGMGCVWDGSGDDKYLANGWASASGAHFCIGVLVDEAGNDQHHVKQNWGPAFGHDFTVAMLVNVGGDDEYHTGDSGIGWGINRSVVGLFDIGGDDTYRFAKEERRPGTAALSPRYTDRSKGSLYWTEAMSCTLFLDVGGDDDYGDRAKDDAASVRDKEAGNASIFVDRAEGAVDLDRAVGSKRRR